MEKGQLIYLEGLKNPVEVTEVNEETGVGYAKGKKIGYSLIRNIHNRKWYYVSDGGGIYPRTGRVITEGEAERLKARDDLKAENEKAVWKVKGKGDPVIEIWESYNGDLYFITEKNGDEIFCYARLYSMPDMAEWGYNSIEYLKQQYGKYKIWKVPKENWGNINTYEEGLLVKME